MNGVDEVAIGIFSLDPCICLEHSVRVFGDWIPDLQSFSVSTYSIKHETNCIWIF